MKFFTEFSYKSHICCILFLYIIRIRNFISANFIVYYPLWKLVDCVKKFRFFVKDC